MRTNSGRAPRKKATAPDTVQDSPVTRPAEQENMTPPISDNPSEAVSEPQESVSADARSDEQERNLEAVRRAQGISEKQDVPLATQDDEAPDISEIEKETVTDGSYDFDFSSIPANVQYDVLPLPSNGECYPNKKSRIPVAYMTAMDENIIASPNMYRDGRVIDVILKRKILDKSFDVDRMCTGDRDAIALWLRATGYGVDFPIVATNPDTGKQYNVNVDLSAFKPREFTLKGDENGWFDYVTESGTEIKFTYISKKDEDTLRDNIAKSVIDIERANIIRYAGYIKAASVRSALSEEDKQYVDDAADDITATVEENVGEESVDEVFPKSITEQMLMYTMAVDGNTDPEYIRSYVENMRSKEALAYRNYILQNRPGMDLSITINVPESDGGGSFDTFLRIDDSIFVNI